MDGSREMPTGSSVVVRRNLIGAGAGGVVFGFIVALAIYGWESGDRALGVGIGFAAAVTALIELVLWLRFPVLVVAPWGIRYRTSVFRKPIEISRQDVTGWTQTSRELLLARTNGPTVKINLTEIRAMDRVRLINGLPYFGYERGEVAYEPD